MRYLIVSFLVSILSSFRTPVKLVHHKIAKLVDSTSNIVRDHVDSLAVGMDTLASQFVDYAKTLIGTRYVWGSANPSVGVDCSGLVNHVSNHFGISVPRTSSQFAHLGTTVTVEEAKPGDLILFAGSNPRKKVVGHMGIVTENPGDHLAFIHSSSGHKRGVHISQLQGYFKTRLVKIIRIFPLNENKVVS